MCGLPTRNPLLFFSRVVNPIMSNSQTASLLYVRIEPYAPIGIKPGEYGCFISGYKCPCVNSNIQEGNVKLIVKCSGYIPEVERQKPDSEEYGTDEDSCQPNQLLFLIAHRNHWNGIQQVIAAII